MLACGVSVPGDATLRPASGFNGNFASLFPGAYQVLQTDRGLTYGGTMLANAGNTSTVVFALTGATPAVPVPIWIRITGPNAADIYFDGLGVTPAMVGVIVLDAIPIALTGAGAGISITPNGGSQVAGDTWKATCSALADQSGNGKNGAQATANRQPVVTAGLNGKVGLLFDGVDDFLTSSVGTLIGFPYLVLVVGRYVSLSAANNAIVSGTTFAGTIYQSTATQTAQYNGATQANPVLWSGLTNQRFAGTYTNSASDSLKVGALALVTGTNGGPALGANRIIGATDIPGQFANAEIFSVIYVPIVSYAAFDLALNSAQGYGPGAIGV